MRWRCSWIHSARSDSLALFCCSWGQEAAKKLDGFHHSFTEGQTFHPRRDRREESRQPPGQACKFLMGWSFRRKKCEAVHRAFVSSLCMSEDSKPLSKPMKGAMANILRCQLRPGHHLDGWHWFLCGQSFGRAGGLGYGST